jgi:N-acetyl-anhydromuramoyl-L-alanine amidase
MSAKRLQGNARPDVTARAASTRRSPNDAPGAPARRLLAIDADGVATLARQVASPNRDRRPPGTEVTLLVVHGISLPPGEFGGDGILDLFTNRLDAEAHPYYATIKALAVSAHFLIRRDGALIQFVPCAERAWHAGKSAWKGKERCNDFSIGVELEGSDEIPYTTAQYAMLARLARALRRRYPVADIVGHSDIAPGRKTDPGPAFDWDRLRRLTAPAVPRK